jgi:hypothetical protein
MTQDRREERRDVIVRRYYAHSYDEALAFYEEDLASMADAGWYPVASTWGWDTVTSAGVLIGGSSWKPGDGTLAVTYRADPRAAST